MTMELLRNTGHTDISDDLVARGWSVTDHYLSDDVCRHLIRRFEELRAEEALTPAGIGRFGDNQIAPDIRRDKTHWLMRNDPVDVLYLDILEGLRQDLNRELFLGLFEYEAHYALYPPGGFYKRHVDALKGEKNRIVSTVFYLNEEWQQGDGGELALYDEKGSPQPLAIVKPHLGTLVTFLSEDIPHEVLPAFKTRRSIAGWFRCNASSADRIDPLR